MSDELSRALKEVDEQKHYVLLKLMQEVDERDLRSRSTSYTDSDDDPTESESDDDRSPQSRLLYYLSPSRTRLTRRKKSRLSKSDTSSSDENSNNDDKKQDEKSDDPIKDDDHASLDVQRSMSGSEEEGEASGGPNVSGATAQAKKSLKRYDEPPPDRSDDEEEDVASIVRKIKKICSSATTLEEFIILNNTVLFELTSRLKRLTAAVVQDKDGAVAGTSRPSIEDEVD